MGNPRKELNQRLLANTVPCMLCAVSWVIQCRRPPRPQVCQRLSTHYDHNGRGVAINTRAALTPEQMLRGVSYTVACTDAHDNGANGAPPYRCGG